MARGRSAVRCTGWRTATCGALRAAGRRPARDSLTDRPPQPARQTSHAVFQLRKTRGKGGASSCMHSVFFRSTSQLSVSYGPALVLRLRPTPHPTSSAPLNHSSCGSNRRTAESPFTSPSGIPSVGSPFPSFPVFGKTSVQLNSVKKKKRISAVFLFSFFNVGFSVASFYVLYSSGF